MATHTDVKKVVNNHQQMKSFELEAFYDDVPEHCWLDMIA